MGNCDCSCNYLYILSFNVGGDSGIAIVSADTDSRAIQILRNSGKYNGHPLDYIIHNYVKLGEIACVRTELLLESYNNALGAFQLFEDSVKWIKGNKGDKGDSVVGPAAGFGEVEATVDDNIGTPWVEVIATGPDVAKNFTFNFHNLKGRDGSGGVGTVVWGEIAGELPNQTDLSNALAAKYAKPSGGIPSTDLSSGVQASLGKADTALQSFVETDPTVPSWAKEPNKPSYSYSEISNTPTIPASLNDLSDVDVSSPTNNYVLTYNGTSSKWEAKPSQGGGGGGGSTVNWGTEGADYVPLSVDGTTKNLLTQHQSISGKADKVSSATSGNFAGLDGNGNLTDSGKKASDFMTESELTSTILNNLWAAATQ